MKSILSISAAVAMASATSPAFAQMGPFGADFYQGMRDQQLRDRCAAGNNYACQELAAELARRQQMQQQQQQQQQQWQQRQQQAELERQRAEIRRQLMENYENCRKLQSANPSANLRCDYPNLY